MDARRLPGRSAFVSSLLVAAVACATWRVDGFESVAFDVRRLALEGRADELIADARREGVELPIAQAEELAEWELRPGAPLGAGTPPPETEELLARGEALYLDRCASCHGADGEGGPPRPYWNEDLTPNRPRDFTSGLMKGGITKEGIVDRILCGMPGTPMPATLFDDVEGAWAVASYVRGMIEPEDWIWALHDSPSSARPTTANTSRCS